MRIEDLIGKQLGRYTVTSLLGRGGMAAVFEAQDSVLRRPVALKVLYGQFLADAGLVERFRREAIIAARLEHSNIVPIYDVGETDGIVYIAMKLLSGRSLQDELLADNSMEPERVAEIITQVAAALDYAHAKGVIHRDIKPGNVILLDDGRAVLSDFGIAKSLDAPGMTGTGVIVGTPDYMAPEQIDSKHGPLDGRSDIYALAVMAYRMLTGERPFDGSTTDVLLAHLTRLPVRASERNPQLPPSIDRVLSTAMAKRPEERTASAGAFARDLAEAIGAATAVGEITPPPASRRPGSPRAAVIPAVAAEQVVSQAATAARAPRPARAAARRQQASWPILVFLGLLIGAVLTGVTMSVMKFRAANSAGATTQGLTAQVFRQAQTSEAGTAVALLARKPTATARPTAAPTAQPTPTETRPPDTPTPDSAGAAPTAEPATPPPPEPTRVVVVQPQPTRVPPTRVPPTPVPPTPVPPSPTPAGCQGPLQGGFGALWRSDVGIAAALGCPTSGEVAVISSIQYFEAGMMYWTAQPNVIYVFHDNSKAWEVYDNIADPSYNEPREGEVPTGKYEPVRGFGRLWHVYPSIRNSLGWGTTPEDNITGVYQFFPGGRMLYSPPFAGFEDRIWVLPYGGGWTRYRDPTK